MSIINPYNGKRLQLELLKYNNGSGDAYSNWVDTTGLEHLSLHIRANQSASFSLGYVWLEGSNFEDNTSPAALTPVAKDGDGTLSGPVLQMPTSGWFGTLLTYSKLPRFVRLANQLTGAGSMVGTLEGVGFGWVV